VPRRITEEDCPREDCSSFQIGADEVDEVFAEFGGEGGVAVLEEVEADVVFEHLGHQRVDASADGGEEHQDLRAVVVVGREGALDGLDLAVDALDAVADFGAVAFGGGHGVVIRRKIP
jgi:hypothetical protein